MRRRRWSTVAICAGLVLLIGAAAFRVFAVPALVRFPLDADKTAHYRGVAVTYVDQQTLTPLSTPKREPLTLDRHVKVVDGDFGHAVVQETITIRAGATTSVEHYRYVMDRRSMKFTGGAGNYAFGDPNATMHNGGSYRVNFAMGTQRDGTYYAFIPEADTQVALQYVRGPHYSPAAGVDVTDFSSKLLAPVAPYYLEHLKAMGLPMEVSAVQLQPTLLASGIDIAKAIAAAGPYLSPAESATIAATLAKPVPLHYFFVVDGAISIEPKTGALVSVHSNAEGVAVQPDFSNANVLKPILEKYSALPAVKAAADGLSALSVKEPQRAQILEYQQTPASQRDIAGVASDQAKMMNLATWWVPIGLAVLGGLLVVLGVILRRRAGRGRPNANVGRDHPIPPQAPVEPILPPLEPVGAPARPDRVSEPV
jgi:DUF3068 family protein